MKNISYRLNVQSTDCNFANAKQTKHFVLVSSGVADMNRIVSEIMDVKPGLERETVEAVLRLEQRIIKKLTLNGLRINNGLFSAVASPKGYGGNTWDSTKNKINIKLTQGAEWRESIQNTTINVLGPKAEVMYIDKVTDVNQEPELQAGKVAIVTGNYIKINGTNDGIGLFIISSDGEKRQIAKEMIAVNKPKTITFVVPADLNPGEYILQIITQYVSSSTLRKEPRTAEIPVTLK